MGSSYYYGQNRFIKMTSKKPARDFYFWIWLSLVLYIADHFLDFLVWIRLPSSIPIYLQWVSQGMLLFKTFTVAMFLGFRDLCLWISITNSCQFCFLEKCSDKSNFEFCLIFENFHRGGYGEVKNWWQNFPIFIPHIKMDKNFHLEYHIKKFLLKLS